MSPALLVLIAAGVILLALLAARRGGRDRRGDLLGPPKGLAASSRPTPPRPPASAASGGEPGDAPSIDDLADRVGDEARRLARQGRKIEAIKLVRTATRWDLARAKAWVERL